MAHESARTEVVCTTEEEIAEQMVKGMHESARDAVGNTTRTTNTAQNTRTQVVRLSNQEQNRTLQEAARASVGNTTRTTAQNTGTRVVRLSEEEQDQILVEDVREGARAAIDNTSPFWSGIEIFLAGFRLLLKDTIKKQLSTLPVVGRWAGRIGTTVTEFVFTVMGTTLHFCKTVFLSPEIWGQAHRAALVAWSANESNGLLAQTYAYAKKMSGYFLEIVKQCLERAIEAHGMEVTDQDKRNISSSLDNLLNF